MAMDLGFHTVGFAKSEKMEPEAQRLENWLNKGKHGQMHYMANHFEKRIDPGKLVPGAKTVISLLYNYHNPEKQKDPTAPKISQYAYGKDYHFVVKEKLWKLLDGIELKEALPTEYKNKFENWMFGCDICQDVCPWNRFAKKHEEPLFEPHADLMEMKKEDWKEITEDVFQKVFQKSAVKRTKLSGLKRNIKFLNID